MKLVLPRDAFNVAVLLKCVGKVTLLINDGLAGRLELDTDELGEQFEIDQDPGTGYLTVSNLRFHVDDEPVYFYTHYNARDNWPLWFVWDDEEDAVFNGRGELDYKFKKLIGA